MKKWTESISTNKVKHDQVANDLHRRTERHVVYVHEERSSTQLDSVESTRMKGSSAEDERAKELGWLEAKRGLAGYMFPISPRSDNRIMITMHGENAAAVRLAISTEETERELLNLSLSVHKLAFVLVPTTPRSDSQHRRKTPHSYLAAFHHAQIDCCHRRHWPVCTPDKTNLRSSLTISRPCTQTGIFGS